MNIKRTKVIEDDDDRQYFFCLRKNTGSKICHNFSGNGSVERNNTEITCFLYSTALSYTKYNTKWYSLSACNQKEINNFMTNQRLYIKYKRPRKQAS